jgi:hypothetical protein
VNIVEFCVVGWTFRDRLGVEAYEQLTGTIQLAFGNVCISTLPCDGALINHLLSHLSY